MVQPMDGKQVRRRLTYSDESKTRGEAGKFCLQQHNPGSRERMQFEAAVGAFRRFQLVAEGA
eukprot:15434206-Alexandrium_andersonii.AAC.1